MISPRIGPRVYRAGLRPAAYFAPVVVVQVFRELVLSWLILVRDEQHELFC